MRIYTSATEHLNNHPYHVFISPLYNPVLPEVLLSGDIEPIYSNVAPHHPVRSMLAIRYMIDMHTTKQSFTIADDIDVIRIFHMLDAYLLEVQDSIPQNPLVKAYVEKVIPFRSDIYTSFRRVLNNHEDWKEEYKKGANRLLEFFNLFMAPMFNKEVKHLDPLEELRASPVSLNPVQNQTVTQTSLLMSPQKVEYVYAE